MPCLVMGLLLSCGRTSRDLHGNSSGGDDGTGTANTTSGVGIGAGGAGPDTGNATSSGGSPATDGEAGGAGTTGSACPAEVAAQSPIRRLSRFEYDNTVRDLLGDTSQPAKALPFDGLPSDGSLVPDDAVSSALVSGYHELAHAYALKATADEATVHTLTGCDPEGDGEEACRDAFVAEFIGRLFRRPPTADELDEFTLVFATGQELGGDFASGVRAVVEVGLQSPEFLYRPEMGEAAQERGGSWARPGPYEMASRLSYLLWGSAPDRSLLDAASRNELRTPEQIESQARRLLEDPRAADPVSHFYLQLLRVQESQFPAVDDPNFPTFTPEIAELMLEETKAYTAHLTLDGQGDFAALLTAPSTFVNGPLAAYYGLDGVSGSEFRRVELDPARSAGLLTQGSFLASTARGPFTDPSRRGAIILTSLLCTPVPFEPPDTGPPPQPLPPNMTTRDRVEQEALDAACAACHSYFDPLGFALEHFDAAGVWRDTENSMPIDATGEILATDAAGSFDGARELSLLLASSTDAKNCFVQNWFVFAYGRAPTPDDSCTLETLERAFADEQENLRELLVALTQTDAFLYRAEVRP